MSVHYGWPRAFAAGITECGGKGFNLARLARYGFPVPRGFVLSAEAYRGAMAEHERLVTAAATLDPTTAEAETALARLRAAIEAAPLGLAVSTSISSGLREHELTDRPVAVRSSGVAEDGAEASFAGMHASVLDVVGQAAIERAVRTCWASLWTPHAVAYRRRMNVSDDDVACAVVICEMVRAAGSAEPLCAGVAFSADPRSGRRNVVVVDLAKGIGENVVSGRVNPDRLVFRVNQGGEIELETREEHGPSLLPSRQENALALLTWRIHWALGDGQVPHDVEWAFDGERLVFLQARPVTRVPYFTFRGGEHLPVIWSTANIKDAVPGVYSMFGWSMLRATVDRVLHANLEAAGYDVPHGLDTVRRFDGRGYFDLTAIEWGLYDALGLMPGEVTKSLGGHQPEIDVPSDKPLKDPEAGGRRGRANLRALRRMLSIRRDYERIAPRYCALMQELVQLDFDAMPNEEILAALRRMLAIHDELDPLVGLANTSAGPLLAMLASLMKSIAGDKGEGLGARLLTGGGGITSADHGYRLLDLSRIAQDDRDALQWLRSGAHATTWTTLPATSRFRSALQQYLAEFGHRSVYEGDVMNPRWAEDPTFLVDQVRTALDAPPVDRRDEAQRISEDAWRELRRYTFLKRPLVRLLVNRARRAMALREETKSALVRSVPPARRIVLSIGRRLVAAGRLDTPEQIFHLSITDFRAYLGGFWDGRGARELARDNEVQRERWLALPDPPDVIIEANGNTRLPSVEPPETQGGESWRGIAASGGVARGTARVIMHPRDGASLKRGDVLVAPSTDPGWTPLFLRASAIVMETGGYLSHGAVVAREYGIPAVVNVPGVLKLVEDGTSLEVDGERGTVRRL